VTEAGDHDEVVVPDLTVGHIDVRGGVGFTSRSSGQWVKILLAPNRLPDLLRPRPALFLSTVTPSYALAELKTRGERPRHTLITALVYCP